MELFFDELFKALSVGRPSGVPLGKKILMKNGLAMSLLILTTPRF